MASSSIAAQLQAIKSQLHGTAEPLQKRPFTRPSLLFDPKQAADIDLRTIFPIALSGLEVLTGLDSRFQSYRSTLFSDASLDADREKMPPKEEERVNKSIASYLRLLAGHLQLPAAVKTLEYLIRRYKIHVYNVDELILCALPYHETHVFVRIMQLIEFRNGTWSFLEGVKLSGAPPPRSVIAQQCVRDRGVLEALCNYASPTKEFGHGRAVVCFCTSVVVEALGSVPKLDDETVKRIIPFVFNGLNLTLKGGHDEKAGALMIVGLITTRATLSPKLVTNLLFYIARLAQEDQNELEDLAWVRIILMALISLVQSQSVHMLPEKSLKLLVQIQDLPGVLVDLSQRFNIRKFLSVFLETLACYSCSDNGCCSTLAILLEAISVKDIVRDVIAKLLGSFLKLSQSQGDSSLRETGTRLGKVLSVIIENYKSELSSTVHKLLENPKRYLMEEEAIQKALWLLFGGSFEKEFGIFEFSDAVPKEKILDPLMLVNPHEEVLRKLKDDDLKVVHAALSMNKLSSMVEPFILLEAFKDVLIRCLNILKKGSPDYAHQASSIGVLCLNVSALYCPVDDSMYLKELSKMIFPLLLIFPKTSKINLRALELAKELKWPFFRDSFASHEIMSMDLLKTLDVEQISSFNVKISQSLANTFTSNPGEYKDWLAECITGFQPSRSLVLLVLLQLVLNFKGDSDGLLQLYDVCFPVVKNDWPSAGHKGNIFLADEFDAEKLKVASSVCMSELVGGNFESGNTLILTFISWAFVQTFASRFQNGDLVHNFPQKLLLDDLFIFFASSNEKLVSKELAFFLVTKCAPSAVQFLSRFYTGDFPVIVQEQCLSFLSRICSGLLKTNGTNTNALLELLDSFPQLMVPLSCETKSVRKAAFSCIDDLFKLCHQFDVSRLKNGNNSPSIDCLSSPVFGKFLGLIISQKKLILSDVNFLPSFLTSILSPSSEGFMMSPDSGERFSQRSKDKMLGFILRSVMDMPSSAKLVIFSLLKGIGKYLLRRTKVRLFFSDLLERRHRMVSGNQNQGLSTAEVEIVCILLEATLLVSDSSCINTELVENVLKVLKVDNLLLDDPAINQPCLAALQNVTSTFYSSLKENMQEKLFSYLVMNFHSQNASIRGAAKEAILRIKVSCTTVLKFLDVMISDSMGNDGGSQKRMKSACDEFSMIFKFFDGGAVSLLSSLLEILLLKKDIENRHFLIEPLFKLLGKLFSGDGIHSLLSDNKQHTDLPPDTCVFNDAITFAQQSTLIILEDIYSSPISNSTVKVELSSKFNIQLLLDCARSNANFTTRNHVFQLLSAFAKVSSDRVLDHMLDLFGLIGEAATKQHDIHSQKVLETLISTLVPCWLSKTDSTKDLLKIFLEALPQIAEHRRSKLTLYLIRTLGEKNSLGNFLALMFQALVLRMVNSTDCDLSTNTASFPVSNYKEWEYLFSEEICNQFPCSTWLPSLVVFFEEIGNDGELTIRCHERLMAMHFILEKLQDAVLLFELKSDINFDHQCTLRLLMGKIILRLEVMRQDKLMLSISGLKKLLKELEQDLLKKVTSIMVPSEFFKGVTQLLDLVDVHVRRKTLQLLRDVLKNGDLVACNLSSKRKNKKSNEHALKLMDDTTVDAFTIMCTKIITLLQLPEDDSKMSLKLLAVSCLEVFTTVFSPSDQIFTESLSAVIAHINSDDMAMSSTSLRCVASLISVLGSKALVELPIIMAKLFRTSHDCLIRKSKHVGLKESTGVGTSISVSHSILLTLEAIVEHLGCFLNPYLGDIMKLLVTHPEYISDSDLSIKTKADSIRKLIVQKIPPRLTLPPLLKLYPVAVEYGEVSLSLVFGTLAIAVNSMDRSSIGNYHGKIFEQCLVALDLRREPPISIKNIDLAEKTVIHAMVLLTMKLTESMFRPLFLRIFEWAESELEATESLTRSVDRTITFYSLVNELLGQHRSLFVPYFKYLLDSMKSCLTDDSIVLRKRKKSKISETGTRLKNQGQSEPKQWHLRALIISSLYKCFLYDSGNRKFLDSSNFQVLLKPIVSQLILDPPLLTGHSSYLPMVEEVDESLVFCLGQMAVTAGSDDMWKQLNHEVLMQTRNEKIRPRILGLRVVKYLIEHLREEYLVLLPETIPFLSELLEDVEHPVKSLAQEIFKELETLSGENLKQYL